MPWLLLPKKGELININIVTAAYEMSLHWQNLAPFLSSVEFQISAVSGQYDDSSILSNDRAQE